MWEQFGHCGYGWRALWGEWLSVWMCVNFSGELPSFFPWAAAVQVHWGLPFYPWYYLLMTLPSQIAPLPSCRNRSFLLEQSITCNQEVALVFPSLSVTAPLPRTTDFYPTEPITFWMLLGIRTVHSPKQALQLTCFFPLLPVWWAHGGWGGGTTEPPAWWFFFHIKTLLKVAPN